MQDEAALAREVFRSDEVRALRADLALALRAAAHHGLGEGVCNHFSVALPDRSSSPGLRIAHFRFRSIEQMRHQAITAVAAKLGIGTPETLRKWVRRAEIDAGQRPGVTTDEAAEIKRLRREVAELRRANEILKAASAFVAAELDRPQPRS